MATRKLEAADLERITWVDQPQISPDGRWVAYVCSTVDEQSREYRSRIWMVSTAGGEPILFTTGRGRDTTPRWSPDGRWLAFVSDRSGTAQIWVMATGGGEARQVTRLRQGAADPVWAPDSRRLAFVTRLGSDEQPESEAADAKERQAERDKEARERRQRGLVVARLGYKLDGRGLWDGRYSQICIIDRAGGELRQLTAGPFDHSEPAFSPDGAQVAFVAHRAADHDLHVSMHLWVVPATGGEPRCLVGGEAVGHRPRWSPDGQFIAYAGHRLEHRGATLYRLFTVPAAGGEPTCLTADFDRSLGDMAITDMTLLGGGDVFSWLPDGRGLVFSASDRGDTGLWQVAAAGGTVTPLVVSPGRVVRYWSLDQAARQAALLITTPLQPPEVFVRSLADGTEQRLTDAGSAWLEGIELSTPEPIRFTGAAGWMIEGWLIKPTGCRSGQRYPLILQIHGGPHTMYANAFFFEFQLLAARGFGVLYTNPRGSHGYGQEFAKAVRGDFGGNDYRDLMAAVDHALQYDWVDPERLGVTGGSYGGFMTNWIVGQTERFRAAVTQRSISNWHSFFGSSDIGSHFAEDQLAGLPWQDHAELLQRSPLSHVESIKTPLLILHAEEDHRCPIEQAEQLFVALRRLGRTVEFVRFPGAGHELSRSGPPPLRIDRLQHLVGWFERHIPRTS